MVAGKKSRVPVNIDGLVLILNFNAPQIYGFDLDFSPDFCPSLSINHTSYSNFQALESMPCQSSYVT